MNEQDFVLAQECIDQQYKLARVSSGLPSDTNVVTPNTECSWDFTTKTRSTNDDGTSLDLEWEDEEGNLSNSGRYNNIYSSELK